MRNFEIDRIDWTLDQFENVFLNDTRKGKVYDYIEDLITVLVETNHIGNANCYKTMLHMLELFDKKLKEKLFSEIDMKYVKAFDLFLHFTVTTITRFSFFIRKMGFHFPF